MDHVTPQRRRAGECRTKPTALAHEDPGMIAIEKLWSTQELANFLGLPVQTIYQWRKRQYGPPGRKMGRHIRYSRSEVERWINSLDRRAA